MKTDNYQKFITSKIKPLIDSGFESDVSEKLFDFQQWIVKAALKAGRYAIFADCGLGKSAMQIEWAHRVNLKTKKPVLILCPLAVAPQTIREAKNIFGYGISRDGVSTGITIANYEQLENLRDDWGGVVLDESSILKNFQGKTKQRLIEKFADVKYKLCCTATPDPNDDTEIGNHAEFLGVMTRLAMLSKFFVHDGGETQKWRLKGHAEGQFIAWLKQWSIVIDNPARYGFTQKNYELPRLETECAWLHTGAQDGQLFADSKFDATKLHEELRRTQDERVNIIAGMCSHLDGQIIVWTLQNEESSKLAKAIPDSVEVTGAMTTEIKEKRINDFVTGKVKILITKPKIAQYGLNMQNCAIQINSGLNFSFEEYYQRVRRSYRFGQEKNVRIINVIPESMKTVWDVIQAKEKNFKKKQAETIEKVTGEYKNKGGKSMKIKKGNYEIINNDCVLAMKEMAADSVGFSVFSPPFADLYTYSDDPNDMSNVGSYSEYMTQFEFMAKELFRILKPGRNVALHCMDLPIQKGKEGFIGLRDYSGEIIKMFNAIGFIYHSRVTIWKNPVTEMQRTKALGLLHKQTRKDSTMSRVGIPDYVLVFRKDGERIDPVHMAIDVDTWQKYASPVWMDIDYGDTLNGRAGRGENDDKHICPLQLPTIERLITLYTNKGDTVFTPFMGIGSEVYQALKMGRKAIGVELKKTYFDVAAKNCEGAEKENSQMTFDLESA
jgi:DNA modification methylase